MNQELNAKDVSTDRELSRRKNAYCDDKNLRLHKNTQKYSTETYKIYDNKRQNLMKEFLQKHHRLQAIDLNKKK